MAMSTSAMEEIDSAKSSASCPICTCNFDEAAVTVALACGHVFHSRCSDEWLKQSQTCPQCRRKLRNQSSDQIRIYLSFGDRDSSGCNGSSSEEAPGLTELREKLAAVTKEQEIAKSLVRRSKMRDALMKRDLNQKQRQLEEYTTQLKACKESLAQQESENSQLMQLLAQDFEEQSEENRRLRQELDEERLKLKERDEQMRAMAVQKDCQTRETADLQDRLLESQQEVMTLMESLEAERSANIQLRDQLLVLEAEGLQMSKRLNNYHAATSSLLLATSLRKLQISQLAVGGDCDRNKLEHVQFGSLPAIPIAAEFEKLSGQH